MLLSQLCEQRQQLKLLRDGSFNRLGMVTTSYDTEEVLTFIENIKYFENLIANPNVTAVISNETVANEVDFPEGMGVIIAESPRLEFYNLHNDLALIDFYWPKFQNRIHPSATIHPTAVLYDHSIEIGENCLIEANVVIDPGTIIGNHCIIRSGSQISTSGFQFLTKGNEVVSVTSAGRVVLEDYVEIQHPSCVDRGVFGGETLIKKYAKIDNLVHIAHNDIIGERTHIVAGTALGGRVTIGSDSWTGINATISNGITIGDDATVSLGSVVTRDVPSDETVTGNFAIDHKKFLDNLRKIR